MLIEGIALPNAVLQLPPIVMGAGHEQTVTFQSFRKCLTEVTFREILEGKRVLKLMLRLSMKMFSGPAILLWI